MRLVSSYLTELITKNQNAEFSEFYACQLLWYHENVPYEFLRVVKFPPIQCSFLRRFMNISSWNFQIAQIWFCLNFSKKLKQTLHHFPWKLIFYWRKLGNAWRLIRHFPWTQQYSVQWAKHCSSCFIFKIWCKTHWTHQKLSKSTL